MCGIAGIFSYRESAPPVDREELLRIREAMINRGPDGAGLWISDDERIGLAHRRLAIIDLSDTGAQPMAPMTANSASPSMARSTTTGNCVPNLKEVATAFTLPDPRPTYPDPRGS